MNNYRQEFEQAIQRTKKLGLSCPKILFSEDRQIKDYSKLPEVFLQTIGEVSSVQQMVAQCLSIHYRLLPAFEKFFDSPVYFTIGWVVDPPHEFHKITEDGIFSLLQEGIKGSTVNIHAWLTLPSMEILDFVFPTTLAYIQKKPENYGLALTKHPSDFTEGLQYHPMLVGVDFLHKIGAISLR